MTTVGIMEGNPAACGIRQYSFGATALPFVNIVSPPVGAEMVGPWLIQIETTSLTDIGLYIMTIEGFLVDHPQVFTQVQFELQVISPCFNTQLMKPFLQSMTFTLKDAPAT
jgi:hypothetical protein